MSMLNRLLSRIASFGLDGRSWFSRAQQPVPPDALPIDRLRLHLFGATFQNQAAADQFCYEVPQPDYPEQLTRELDGAFIDTAQVEVICGPILLRLQEFLSNADADDILLRLGADNSLIIITELAFGGLPYQLDDTETLTYLGAIVVDV